MIEAGTKYPIALWQKWSVLSDDAVIVAGTYLRVEVTTTAPVSESSLVWLANTVKSYGAPYYRISSQSVVIELVTEANTTPIEQENHYVPMIDTYLEYKEERARVKDFTMSAVGTNYSIIVGGLVALGIVLGLYYFRRKI